MEHLAPENVVHDVTVVDSLKRRDVGVVEAYSRVDRLQEISKDSEPL